MQNSDGYLYVVLVKAQTGLGKFARRIGGYEYTHIAVCPDDKMEDFITFSRKYHYSPFDSGFMHETPDCYAFGDIKNVKLKVFKIPVEKQRRELIESYIFGIANDGEYLFNLYSMATMSLFHGFRIYKTHNCMSFVAKIVELSGCVEMKKKYYKYSIPDMDELLSEYFFKEEYLAPKRVYRSDYMKRVGFFKNMFLFIRLNVLLTFRLIFRGRRINDQ